MDVISASFAEIENDRSFLFKATNNSDELYIQNKGMETKMSYTSLKKLGKDLFSCVSNRQLHSNAIYFVMKHLMDYFKREVDMEVHFVRLDANVIDTYLQSNIECNGNTDLNNNRDATIQNYPKESNCGGESLLIEM